MSAVNLLLSSVFGAVTLSGCASVDPPTYDGPAWHAVQFVQRGAFCSAPCDFSLYVRVEPRPENRELTVVCVSGGMERASGHELNERSPAMQDRFLFRGLSAGDYHCRASVMRADGSVRYDDTIIKVLGRLP